MTASKSYLTGPQGTEWWFHSLILFSWETHSQLFPSWFKRPVCSAQTSPRAAFLPMNSLFWLLCLHKSTASARGLSLGLLTSWYCIPFRISPPPLDFLPYVVTCMFIQVSLEQGVLGRGAKEADKENNV